jgi:DNA invertase Pin-like site-specific DNA recombinase
MLIEYVRVSTDDHKLELQYDAMAEAGVERIYEDKESGAWDDRPRLAAALKACRDGDVLVSGNSIASAAPRAA